MACPTTRECCLKPGVCAFEMKPPEVSYELLAEFFRDNNETTDKGWNLSCNNNEGEEFPSKWPVRWVLSPSLIEQLPQAIKSNIEMELRIRGCAIHLLHKVCAKAGRRVGEDRITISSLGYPGNLLPLFCSIVLHRFFSVHDVTNLNIPIAITAVCCLGKSIMNIYSSENLPLYRMDTSDWLHTVAGIVNGCTCKCYPDISVDDATIRRVSDTVTQIVATQPLDLVPDLGFKYLVRFFITFQMKQEFKHKSSFLRDLCMQLFKLLTRSIMSLLFPALPLAGLLLQYVCKNIMDKGLCEVWTFDKENCELFESFVQQETSMHHMEIEDDCCWPQLFRIDEIDIARFDRLVSCLVTVNNPCKKN
ncbi:hypothetical protein PCE1_001213 [Barthelona sp. PCE]